MVRVPFGRASNWFLVYLHNRVGQDSWLPVCGKTDGATISSQAPALSEAAGNGTRRGRQAMATTAMHVPTIRTCRVMSGSVVGDGPAERDVKLAHRRHQHG